MVVGVVIFFVHLWLGGDTLCIHCHRDCRTIRNEDMSPQEKAKELVDLFTVIGLQQRNEGIQCAILSVDKILEVLSSKSVSNEFWIMYYEQVKKEIELL